MKFTKMTLAGLLRDVPEAQVGHYESYGWERIVDSSPGEPQTSQDSSIDSSATPARAPKKKTAKSAEIAPEAAQEDQGNAITQGE
jgi:hypothetical protein